MRKVKEGPSVDVSEGRGNSAQMRLSQDIVVIRGDQNIRDDASVRFPAKAVGFRGIVLRADDGDGRVENGRGKIGGPFEAIEEAAKVLVGVDSVEHVLKNLRI